MSAVSRIRGVTLVELMIIIVVIGILATIAIPSFQEIIRRNQIASQNNELVALIHMARNEAIRRNPLGVGVDSTVRLELVPGAGTWAGNVRPPGSTEPVAGCPVGAVRCSAGRNADLSGAVDLRFDNRGYSVVLAGGSLGLADVIELSLVHVNCTNDLHARRIRVLPTGQVLSEPRPCSD